MTSFAKQTPFLYGLTGDIATLSQYSTRSHKSDFTYNVIKANDDVNRLWGYWDQWTPDGPS